VGPDRLALRFAGGNPARQAVLDVGVARRGSVRLEVFDLRGAVVRTVADREFEAGWHRLRWDARDAAGRTVEPGLYFLRARMPRETAISRFVLVR
jgi:flagellar hook assembly protein FlgD